MRARVLSGPGLLQFHLLKRKLLICNPCPTLLHADRLRDLEKKTGQPKAYLFFAFVSLLTTIVMSIGGSKLLSDIFAFVYPAYMSFKAIDSSDASDDTQWLTYWVVFASFAVTESIMTFITAWIPFYYIIKSAFFMWLYHPKFMGAGLVYKQIIK